MTTKQAQPSADRKPGLAHMQTQWFRDNLREAAADFRSAFRSWSELRAFRRVLERLGDKANAPDPGSECGASIRAIHFVYGLKQVETFPLFALMAILSAKAYHPRATVFFFCHKEPVGPYWEFAKQNVQYVTIPDFRYFGAARIRHYAHRSDVVRLLALQHIGGLYLDTDTITLRSMDELASHDFVLGVQQALAHIKGGLCNAIMVGRRGSHFVKRWLRSYRYFRARGRDDLWDFHSVKLPMILYAERPNGVVILPHDRWFFPLWTSIERVLFDSAQLAAKRSLFEGQYAIHLWHNMIPARLDGLNPMALRQANLYAEFIAEAVQQLPAETRSELEALFREISGTEWSWSADLLEPEPKPAKRKLQKVFA